MNHANKIRCLVFATLWVLLFYAPARALDPNQPASNLLITHFTTDNGLPGAVVGQAEQTQDGFLWLITNGNYLNRFDGRTFYYFEKPRPVTLAAAPDGDLWVGTREELIRIPSSNLNQFSLGDLVSYHPGPGKASQIICLHFSRSGVLWVGTADGLFRYERDHFVAFGPRVPTSHIEETPDGHILLITEEGFTEFDGTAEVPHPGLATQLGVKDKEIFDVLKDHHGNTWYCTKMGLAREASGRIERLGTYARPGHEAYRAYEDARGTVWIGKEEGLFRATSAGLELVAAGMQVRSLCGDSDGNLWVSTKADGLYRFKERAVRMFTTDDGLPNNVIMTVLAARDGAVWTGANCGGITRFDGTHFYTFNQENGLPNDCVFALAEDANRDLWIGTWGGGAFQYHDGKFTQYSKSQGMADDIVTSIVAARDGAVWFGTHSGVSCLRNGQLRNFTMADGLSAAPVSGIFEDRAGVIWIGTRQGLDRLVGDRFEQVSAFPKTLVIPFGEDRDGGFFVLVEVDGEGTTRRLVKDRVDTYLELNSDDLVETEQGELWFGGSPISRVPSGVLAHSRSRDDLWIMNPSRLPMAWRPLMLPRVKKVWRSLVMANSGPPLRKDWRCSIFVACRSPTRSLRSI